MLFSAVTYVISDDFTRSWQWYANSCIAFFILKQLRNQLTEKKIDHINIDVYKEYIIKAFFLVSSIWEYSPQAVYLMTFVSLVRVKILFHVLDSSVTENYSFSFSCSRTNTVLSSLGGKLIFYLDKC